MSVQALPRPTNIVWYSGAWPRADLNMTVAAGNFDPVGRQRGSPGGLTVFSALVGTANNQMVVYRDQLAGRFDSGAGTFSQRNGDGFRAQFPLSQLTVGASYRVAEWQRVYRFSCALALPVVNNLAADGGMAWVLQPDSGADGTYPSAAGNGAGFGIQGNGAGGLQWFSKPTLVGGFTDVTALAWPQVLTEWTYLDWEIRAANGVGPASVRLFINGVLAITRAWGVGTVLPADYTAATLGFASNGQWKPCFRNATNGAQLAISSVQFLSGRFTTEDVEQLNGENGSI